MNLVSSFEALLQAFSGCFTAPSFATFVTLLTGWVFARRRTVTGAILAAGAQERKHHSAYHRLLASARWSMDALGLALFGLILPFCGSTIFLIGDDTLAHKHGRKMFGAGMHYDRSISSKKTILKSWGHCWVVLGVAARFPFRQDGWLCLPVLFRLYRNKKTVARKGGTYYTRPELLLQMLQVLCPRHPDRRFHLLVDSAYGGQNVLRGLPDHCDMTAGWITNARLCARAAPKASTRKGPQPKRGAPLPSAAALLEGRCSRRTLSLYAEPEGFRIADCQACLYTVPERLLRIVATESLKGQHLRRAFFSTVANASAEQVLTWYAIRWSVEVTFHDTKGHLGFEQPQGWTRRAVRRSAPLLLLLYSLFVLWFAQEGHRHYRPLNRPWYPFKVAPSFADMLATLRCQSIQERYSQTPPTEQGRKEVLESFLEALRQPA